MTYEYIRVTYESHASGIWVTYEWHISKYKWHTSGIRMARNITSKQRWHSHCQLRITGYLNKIFYLLRQYSYESSSEKCNLLLNSKNLQMISTSGTTVTFGTAETLLDTIIDSKLNFEYHLNSICRKVSRKLNALDRVSNNCMPLGKRRIWWNIHRMSVSLMSSNMDVTFEKYINNKINRLHERASRIVYSNYASSFQGLLNKDNAFSIHESLAIEIYKYWIIYSINIYQARKLFEIDKNFIPEILRQLHMELKPYYIWHLKFGARFLKLWKWAHLDKSECVCRLLCKIFATCWVL